MRTAVDRIGTGKERQVNARFLAMTNHYLFGSYGGKWVTGRIKRRF